MKPTDLCECGHYGFNHTMNAGKCGVCQPCLEFRPASAPPLPPGDATPTETVDLSWKPGDAGRLLAALEGHEHDVEISPYTFKHALAALVEAEARIAADAREREKGPKTKDGMPVSLLTMVYIPLFNGRFPAVSMYFRDGAYYIGTMISDHLFDLAECYSDAEAFALAAPRATAEDGQAGKTGEKHA
jgi:hypothetical protein